MLVGPFDTNPSALKPEELDTYIASGAIEYSRRTERCKTIYTMCSTYVLPSYHEGTPKTVLEAMAMGRAIITTDAPGCRETVVEGENGYLIETKNVNQLISKNGVSYDES
jgi:glycosyltransferase involved in cell wall biosynthesis